MQEQLNSFAKGFLVRATELLPTLTVVTFCSYYVQITKGSSIYLYSFVSVVTDGGGGGGGEEEARRAWPVYG